jgi:hypothetical protein
MRLPVVYEYIDEINVLSAMLTWVSGTTLPTRTLSKRFEMLLLVQSACSSCVITQMMLKYSSRYIYSHAFLYCSSNLLTQSH